MAVLPHQAEDETRVHRLEGDVAPEPRGCEGEVALGSAGGPGREVPTRRGAISASRRSSNPDGAPGRYVRGTTTLLVGPDGTSRITAEDRAVAAVDELERPRTDPHFTINELAVCR